MKKFLGIMILSLLLYGNAYGKIFTLNKCWVPIEKNVYGDKVKNFKEFKITREIEDHIIKIDSEKKTIVKRYVLDDKKDIDPFDQKKNIFTYKISNFKNGIINGKFNYTSFLGYYYRDQMITVDLNRRKAAIWNSTKDKKTIKFDISCKLYKGSDDSILRSILKMIN
jgi:hypothetical protein